MKPNFYTESILYWLARGLSAVACALPPTASVGLGRLLGRLAYHGMPRRRQVALSNLRMAFEGTCGPREFARLVREVFEHFGMTLMEVAMIPRMDRAYIDRWVQVAPESFTRVESALSKGHGAIFLAGHFGNWELNSLVGALHGYSILALVREQGWPRLNALLNQYRQSRGCQVVTKGFPIRELIEGLQAGSLVGIVSDQDGGSHGVLTPFFGRLASSAPGVISLGLNTQAPILPVFSVRRRGPAHTLYVEEPLSIPSDGPLQERIRAGVEGYTKLLESYVRRYPTQWLWVHRRWKSSPQRQLLLLTDGKAGHASQLQAFSHRMEAALKEKFKEDKRLAGISTPLLKVKTVEVLFWNRLARLGVSLAACVGPKGWGTHAILKAGLKPASYRALVSSAADLVASCGSAAAGVNLLLAASLGARAIQINRCRFPSWRRFDLTVISRHDHPPASASNRILVVDGALAQALSLDGDRLRRWRRLLGLRRARHIGLLVGGKGPGVSLDLTDLRQVVEGLLGAAQELDAELLVTSSRRTGPALEACLRQALKDHPLCRLLVLVNDRQTGGLSSAQEAIPCILGLSQVLVVSGDSISMVSEALANGHPVVSFLPRSTGWLPREPKHHRFLKGMARDGKLTLAEPQAVGEAVAQAFKRNPSLPPSPSDPVVEHLARWL